MVLVEEVVTKVTPKQFTVLNEKYKKEDGACIGDSSSKVCIDGDLLYGKKITNETKEYFEFIDKVSLVISIKDLLYKIEGSQLIESDDLTLIDLKNILEKVLSKKV